MTLVLGNSLWIDFTRARSPAPLKQFIAPCVLDALHRLIRSARLGVTAGQSRNTGREESLRVFINDYIGLHCHDNIQQPV